MIGVEVKDTNDSIIYRSHRARWSLTGSWVSIGPSDGNGRGPFFTVYLPLSLRALPRRGTIASYVGEGKLGSVSMWGGALARDGGGHHDLDKVIAASKVQSMELNLMLDVVLGKPHLDSFQGGRPWLSPGTKYTINVTVPLDDYAEFSDTRKTTEAWRSLSMRLKENFNFDLAPWESID
ncbi:hypothetical protein [Sphingopyxis sp.]|uniref:hypothetical protein n=1 Tax=Sphingopyxis sp. TaxID=1908224 RepID=UPI003D6D43D5